MKKFKEYSLKNFGALPHLSIARNDKTKNIEYLTSLSMSEYNKTWEQFDSDFWRFKKSIFGKYQNKYCYAGKWSAYVDLTTGVASQCYCGVSLGDVFEHPEKSFPEAPIGKCRLAHCYNGHLLLTLGLIPNFTEVSYGNIRDREKTDGAHWLQPNLKDFFNGKLDENNSQLSNLGKIAAQTGILFSRIARKINSTIK